MTYRNYFIKNFNFSFVQPQSDICYHNKINLATNTEEKHQLISENMEHLQQAQNFYGDLKEKIDLAKNNDKVKTICIDSQKIRYYEKFLLMIGIIQKNYAYIHFVYIYIGISSKSYFLNL